MSDYIKRAKKNGPHQITVIAEITDDVCVPRIIALVHGNEPEAFAMLDRLKEHNAIIGHKVEYAVYKYNPVCEVERHDGVHYIDKL